MNILITGAAGNLGSLLVKHLLTHSVETLRLMIHENDVLQEVKDSDKTEIIRADLSRKDTLLPAVKGSDVIVHFAGVLFKANPEKFLPQTNFQYFKNLVDSANELGVKKIILISFPHVEGPTTFDNPAKGTLEGNPISVHAQTRLEAEKYLFKNIDTPISLRLGMVYGDGIIMVDTAKWFSKRCMLGIWKEPTQIHLISKLDFCLATANAISNSSAKGIYHIGDDGRVTLQEFLNIACEQWGTRRPWNMPLWMIYSAARTFELFSQMFNIKAPLTKDFIDIGRVSYYGDTSRMKLDLLPALTYPSISEGRETLSPNHTG